MSDTIIRRKRLPQVDNDNVSIYVRNYAKKAITLNVPPKLKLQVLKQNIKRRMKVNYEDQALFINGNRITEENEEIDVDNRLIIHLVNLKRVGLEKISIIVKRPIDRSPIYKYNIKSEMKISDFMNTLLVSDYPDIQNYFLVYTCRELMPQNTFKMQYIEDQSEIICVHKIQDRKSQVVEIRRLPAQHHRAPINMTRKKRSEEEKNPQIHGKYIKIGSIKSTQQQKNIQQQQQFSKPIEIEKQQTPIQTQNFEPINKTENELILASNKKQQIEDKQEIQNVQKIIEEENKEKVSDIKEQSDLKKQHENSCGSHQDEEVEEITITNKQSYTIISKDNPGQQNKNIRKKMHQNFAAPEPLHDDQQEQQQLEQEQKDSVNQRQKQNESSSYYGRDNTHLGLTVISSRHDEEQSIEPNQLQYRHLLSRDQDQQKHIVNRSNSEPLHMTPISFENGGTNREQSVPVLDEETPFQQLKKPQNSIKDQHEQQIHEKQHQKENNKQDNQQDNQQNNQQNNQQSNEQNTENIIITETEVQSVVCQPVQEPKQPQMTEWGAEEQYGKQQKQQLNQIAEQQQIYKQDQINNNTNNQQINLLEQTTKNQGNFYQKNNNNQQRQQRQKNQRQLIIQEVIEQQIDVFPTPVLKTSNSKEFMQIMNQRVGSFSNIPLQKIQQQQKYYEQQVELAKGNLGNQPKKQQSLPSDNLLEQSQQDESKQIIEDNNQTQFQLLGAVEKISQSNIPQNQSSQNRVNITQQDGSKTAELNSSSNPKKRSKSDSESLLLDNSGDGRNNENILSDRFIWNNLSNIRDQKALIDMSAQLQQQGLNLTEIIPGTNVKNWEKLSFSFRNNEPTQFKSGDFLMLGNAHSLGLENIRQQIFTEFEQKLAQLEAKQT